MTIDELLAMVHRHKEQLDQHAQQHQIDPLALRSQLLLHLPRRPLYTATGFQEELEAVSARLEAKQAPYRDWLTPPEAPLSLAQLEFGSLDEATAQTYHEAFHYVGSYRPGQHYALRHKMKIVAMGSVASFDLKHVAAKLDLDPHFISIYSRFYAYRWAPPNTFSHFHGKLRQHLIKTRDTKLMFSFINPNLGFDGRSHKAAQWRAFATEEATQYMYLSGQYRTMRYFINTYGTNDVTQLKKLPGFETASMELKPLLILANPLQRSVQQLLPSTPYVFQRPRM